MALFQPSSRRSTGSAAPQPSGRASARTRLILRYFLFVIIAVFSPGFMRSFVTDTATRAARGVKPREGF